MDFGVAFIRHWTLQLQRQAFVPWFSKGSYQWQTRLKRKTPRPLNSRGKGQKVKEEIEKHDKEIYRFSSVKVIY